MGCIYLPSVLTEVACLEILSGFVTPIHHHEGTFRVVGFGIVLCMDHIVVDTTEIAEAAPRDAAIGHQAVDRHVNGCVALVPSPKHFVSQGGRHFGMAIDFGEVGAIMESIGSNSGHGVPYDEAAIEADTILESPLSDCGNGARNGQAAREATVAIECLGFNRGHKVVVPVIVKISVFGDVQLAGGTDAVDVAFKGDSGAIRVEGIDQVV